MFKCDNLWAWYNSSQDPVLKNISLTIPEGFTVFCGPNGSGKTTLFRIFRGLHELFGIKVEGKMYINDIELTKKPPETIGKYIGMVFQRPITQLFNITVSDEIRSGPIFIGCEWSEVLRREKEVLEKIGIFYLKDKVVYQMSAGEQQKCVIASILALKPELLLLDEPTSYLDQASRKDLLDTLKKLSEEGINILMTSHRLEEEIRYADYMVVLDKGGIFTEGTPEDVMFTPNMNRVLPPRGFLKIGNELWNKKKNRKKILTPNELKLPKIATVQKGLKMPNPPLVRFEKVSVVYPDGTVGLRNTSLRIPKGSITTVLGPNGSGKTTLAKVCLKILKPLKGKILIDNKDLSEIDTAEVPKLMGYAPQDPLDMIFCDSVYEEIMFGVRNLELDHPNERVRDALNKIKIEGLSDKFPEILSLGQQRQLTLAICLAIRPKLLFLDEPELALDPNAIESLTSILLELKNETTIVILTHDVDTFVPLSDYVILLSGGAVVSEGYPRDILTKEAAEKIKLKVPELWDIWKINPEIKSWDELSRKVVRLYDD